MRKCTLTLISLVFILISCGGGGGVEGFGEFYSVITGISGVYPTKLESDVFTKLDIDGDGVCDDISFQDDSIVVRISSQPLVPDSPDFKASAVYFDRYKLTFVNASSANNCERNSICKTLFSTPLERLVNGVVEPNGETLLTLNVIPIDWKSNILINFCTSAADSCVYNVILELHAVEVLSGKENWLKATFTVQIADYIKSNSIGVDENGNLIQIGKEDANCSFQLGR